SRLAEQALDSGQRRFEAHQSALALQTFQQRSFFATNIGSCRLAYLEVELTPTTLDIAAQPACGLGCRNGGLQGGNGMRILGTYVDIALGGSYGQGSNRHTFDQGAGISLHQHTVGKSTGIAFVGITDNVFLLGGCIQYRLPLDACGESCATAASQARGL